MDIQRRRSGKRRRRSSSVALFGDPPGDKNVGLFGDASDDAAAASVFGNPPATGGLFGEPPPNSGADLFTKPPRRSGRKQRRGTAS